MTKIHSSSLDRSIDVERIIGHIEGTTSTATIIFFGGIHGNENSGVFALHDVIKQIENDSISVDGNIYAISGNIPALAKGIRYEKEDLNRVWTDERLSVLQDETLQNNNREAAQQLEILKLIHQILRQEEGPFYFIDLHTTSSQTNPFAMVNDSLLNRKFTCQYPIPIILGIEEFLDGPLLSYVNELGYVSFGYEAGQHDALASYENQVAFIYTSLVFAEIIDRGAIDFNLYYERLARTSATSRDIYEIKFQFKINNGDTFKMHPGYVNFQKVRKGEELAEKNNAKVKASHTGRIFMPLYQNQGKEGFFEIVRIPTVFLRLSKVLRKTKIDHLLPILPGIKWASQQKDTLTVNLKVARFFAKQFLHLLGYRSKKIDKTHLTIKSREVAAKTADYEDTKWFQRDTDF